MKRGLIGRAVFIRHGQSEYTDVFPDLTDQGKLEIRASAGAIKKARVDANNSAAIDSSLAVRALGSASMISEALGFIKIRQAPLISPPEIRDREKAMALYGEYISNGGMRALCVAYSRDDRFEDGKIFEPRKEVCKRFYRYLGMLTRSFLAGDLHNFVVAVTHYEVLSHFVERFFHLDYSKQDPLDFAELIVLSFRSVFLEDSVEISVTFRGMSARIFFNHKSDMVVAGPYK